MSSSAPPPDVQPSKPRRVLACIRCQQKKVKCDRRFPCANCTTLHEKCIPATLTPRGPRRPRFPERELLDRVRKYEELLRRNNIAFEPLHKDSDGKHASSHTQNYNVSDEQPKAMALSCPTHPTTHKLERSYEAKDFWEALNSGSHEVGNDSDSSQGEVREMVTKKGWVQLFGDNDHLLFGSPNINVDLSTLHPEPVQIFRLWQIYLDNVNPLLKVTHTPSLQGRIIEAASNVKIINPTLEALMFSIYCMAILSLNVDDCQVIFGSSREDLLTRFHFGCQQALLNSGFLRSGDRDSLTALYLYLISVRPSTVPQSLSAMLGVAIRIAQQMGIQSEAALAKCNVFEAEMRRRLWWSLVLFDTRISEMADYKNTTLAPTWDCRTPLNINDTDLQPEMRELPMAQGKPTDALFAAVRSELGDFVRHTTFHLDFTSPVLKPIFKTQSSLDSDGDNLANLEKTIQNKYLKFCDLDNALHFMTIWWTRAYLAKCCLWEHHSRYSSSPVHPTDAQREAAISYALRMLECDTKLRSSPLTKRFLWLIHLHFAFPAYLQILQDLRKRPGSEQADQAWEAMSANYEARFVFVAQDRDSPFYTTFTKLVLHAWEAREAASNQLGEPVVPKIVLSIKNNLAERNANSRIDSTAQFDGSMNVGLDNTSLSMPVSSGHSLPFHLGGNGGLGGLGFGGFANMLGQPSLGVDVNQLEWPTMDWGLGGVYPGVWNS
ncbi:putative C6 transcription factor [Tricladium varicosporioides]|nr:putative C6 transcription factor [Hymenoscyphus varicosporioides]